MSVTAAQGFRASGVAAGLKSSGAADVAMVVNDGPSSAAAAVFTGNRCKANPVIWSQEAIKAGSARAVALNSGGVSFRNDVYVPLALRRYGYTEPASEPSMLLSLGEPMNSRI